MVCKPPGIVDHKSNAVYRCQLGPLRPHAHEISEEPGMEQCTEDLRAFFPQLRVEHIPAGQPMWNAEHPPVPAVSGPASK
jgi:hypothetical protein